MSEEKNISTTIVDGVEVLNEAELMEKYDRESKYRHLEGIPRAIVFVIGVSWSIFHLYTGLFGVFPSTLQRAPHLAAAMVLAYLLYPIHGKAGKTIPIWDWVCCGLAFFCGAYHVFNYEALLLRAGLYTQTDMIVSIIAIILLLEAARRVVGPIIVGLGIFFLIYAVFGQYFPGFLGHGGLSLKRVVCFEFLGTEGILGTPIYVSSSFIYLFLIFATFLKNSGVGDWMTGMAMGACGGAAGGPAKAAVIASALEGTVSGSSVANTVGSGSITIPLMKKTGYRPEFAGAVEAAASTGGQIMPPIMGAAAFIMTEYVGVPYNTIAFAAVIPAILYFTGIYANVHFEAMRKGLLGVPKEQRPSVSHLMKTGWYKIAPLLIIIFLLGSGRSVMYSALFGIVACMVIWLINVFTSGEKFNPVEFGKMFISSLEETARGAISVVLACGCAGIIVGSITMTGLGLKLAGGIVELSGGHLMLTLVLTMFCCIFLGLGLPTTANYIIQATITAPALVELGIPPLAAHMFVFYFGIVADITPLVGLAAIAGAGIAGASTIKTGLNASRLGISAYVAPYVFVLNPVLLLINTQNWSTPVFVLMILEAAIITIVGMVCLAMGLSGYCVMPCNVIERFILIAGGIFMVIPSAWSDILGIAILVIMIVQQTIRKRKTPVAANRS